MSEPFIGQVFLVGFGFAARTFSLCEGQLIAISQNSAMFSLLGTVFGGDGRTTFGLPDLRGRVAIGQGNGPGLSSHRLGGRGGIEDVVLSSNQMPSHTHTMTLKAEKRSGNLEDPTNNMLAGSVDSYRAQIAADDVVMNPASVTAGTTGGNQGHTNMQPFLVMNYQIAMYGLFPSRS